MQVFLKCTVKSQCSLSRTALSKTGHLNSGLQKQIKNDTPKTKGSSRFKALFSVWGLGKQTFALEQVWFQMARLRPIYFLVLLQVVTQQF